MANLIGSLFVPILLLSYSFVIQCQYICSSPFMKSKEYNAIKLNKKLFDDSVCKNYVNLNEKETCCTNSLFEKIMKHLIKYRRWMCPACLATYISLLCQMCSVKTNHWFKMKQWKIDGKLVNILFDSCVYNQYDRSYSVETMGLCSDHRTCTIEEFTSNIGQMIEKEIVVVNDDSKGEENVKDKSKLKNDVIYVKKMYKCNEINEFGYCYCSDCRTCLNDTMGNKSSERLFGRLNVRHTFRDTRLRQGDPRYFSMVFGTIFTLVNLYIIFFIFQ